jgi:hypothetical protein
MVVIYFCYFLGLVSDRGVMWSKLLTIQVRSRKLSSNELSILVCIQYQGRYEPTE